MQVRAPAAIALEDRVELGEVTGGMRWQDTCVSVPLTTTGLAGERLRVSASIPEGCVGKLVTSKDGAPLSLAEGIELTARPSMHLPVCLEVAP